jgi:hypothetical protein
VEYEDYKEFFKHCGDYHLEARYFECEQGFSVDEMYEHFKARLIEELRANKLNGKLYEK